MTAETSTAPSHGSVEPAEGTPERTLFDALRAIANRRPRYDQMENAFRRSRHDAQAALYDYQEAKERAS